MKILVTSDLHYETGKRRFHIKGFDEAKALTWISGVADEANADSLIILGDIGDSISRQEWDALAARFEIFSIYGNHDKYPLMKRIRNQDGSGVLMQDGQVKTLDGLRFGFINGIVTHSGKQKHGVPRKTPEQFVHFAEQMRHQIDFLCTHESPPVYLYRKKLLGAENVLAAKLAADIAEPKIMLSGHLGFGPYSIAPIMDTKAVVSIRMDGSQDNRGYALINTRRKDLTVYVDRQPKYTLRIPETVQQAEEIIANVNRFNENRGASFKALVRTAEKHDMGLAEVKLRKILV